MAPSVDDGPTLRTAVRCATADASDRSSEPPVTHPTSPDDHLARRRPRRTWPQRGLLALSTLAIVASVATATTLAYAKHRVDQMPRTSITVEGFRPAAELASDAPRNILLVGADDATTLPAGSPEQAAREEVGGVRSDTIMVVRLDPATKTARILSFPRDLWVPIPSASPNRINAALQFGGPSRLVETLQANFGIEINGYVQIDFNGFKRLVEEVDGVPIYFDAPVGDGSSEGSSGLHVDGSGCALLDGTGSLQYVRSRHFYRIVDGRKVYDGTSDIGRIKRQQDFIQRLMHRAILKGARDPRKLASYLQIATEDITLDQGTTAQDLLDLASVFRQFDPAKLQTDTVPTTPVTRGGAAVLEVRAKEAAPILARFRTPGPGQFAEATAIALTVSNGTGGTDEGARYAQALTAPGFQTTIGPDSPHVARTQVRYPAGAEADAAVVASFLDADPELIRDRTVTAITLVTGPDLRAVRTKPAKVATPSTTTTTPKPSGSGSTGHSAGSTTSTTSVARSSDGYVPGPDPKGDCG